MTKPSSDKPRRQPREGFRRRINPYYGGMNRREIAWDTAKTATRWLVVTVLAYGYWLAMLLLLSLFLVNVWKVSFTQLLIYSGILCGVTSVVYAGVLVHRKLYY